MFDVYIHVYLEKAQGEAQKEREGRDGGRLAEMMTRSHKLSKQVFECFEKMGKLPKTTCTGIVHPGIHQNNNATGISEHT